MAKVAVIRDNNVFKMWYDGRNLLSETQVGLATSAGGITWNTSAANPVLGGTPGDWDDFGIWGPSVLRYNGLYWMWYGGAGPQWAPAIGVATSFDGVTWTRVGTAPKRAASMRLPPV